MYKKFKKNRYQWKKRKHSCYKEKNKFKWISNLLKLENKGPTSMNDNKTKNKKKKKVQKKISKLSEKFFPNGKIQK